MLGLVGLRAAEQEHHVRVVRRARPDLLPVDHEVAVLHLGPGLGRGQIAARARLGVALAPDDLAADGGLDPPGALLPGADLQKGRHQHADALVHDAGIDVRLGDLLGDDGELEHVEGQAEAAVLLGNAAGEIAVLQKQLLPIERLGAGLLPPAAWLWREVAVLGDEGPHLALQRSVLFRVGQLHAPCSIVKP